MASITDQDGVSVSFTDTTVPGRATELAAEDGQIILAEDGVAIGSEDDDWIGDTADVSISLTDMDGV